MAMGNFMSAKVATKERGEEETKLKKNRKSDYTKNYLYKIRGGVNQQMQNVQKKMEIKPYSRRLAKKKKGLKQRGNVDNGVWRGCHMQLSQPKKGGGEKVERAVAYTRKGEKNGGEMNPTLRAPTISKRGRQKLKQ